MAGLSAEYDFPLFKLVNEARATYGLRHSDYARYHAHCTAKVHHLRKSANLVQTTSNKNKKFTRKEITADGVSSQKHLQILLFETERAWAHAQEVKAAASNPQTLTGSRKHFIKRLAKAVGRAQQLNQVVASLSSTKISSYQRGQVTAYFLTMKGLHDFEKGRHEAGVKTLSVAHELLIKLSETASSAHDQALANEMIDEVEPMLRFCAYKLEIDTSAGVGSLARETTSKEAEAVLSGYSALIEELDRSSQHRSRETVELTWRGKDVPVRSAELVDVVLKVKQAISSLVTDSSVQESAKGKGGKHRRSAAMGSRRMVTYDKVLLVLSDAEAVASQLVDDNKVALSKSTSARHEASSAPLELARAVVIYQLLAVRIKRDLLLVQDTAAKLDAREAKIRDVEREYVAKTGRRDEEKADRKIRKQRARMYPSIVKLYDNVIQSLEQMRDLEAVEQDGDLATKVEARIAAVRASRCMYLARSYALVEQHASALSLNSRGKIYSRQARHNASSVFDAQEFDEPDFADDLLPLSDESFDELDRQLEADYIVLSKAWFGVTGGLVGDNLEPEDLAVDELEIGSEPSKEKAKKKPAFYDVAFNYIAAFDMDAIARRAGLKQGAAGVAEDDDDEFHEAAEGEDDEQQGMDAEEEDEEQVQEQEAQPAKRGWGFGLFGRR
ncbi:signal recognition particle subunit srp68 [Microbotryomycetes sp. JL201]|nr:signal recognition particle subunit srp68 [Microbotryomycetes sp. JL201]